MKVFIALACLFAVSQATLLSTGSSTSSRQQDAAGNYAFAYNEQHATGGSSRKEAGNPHGVTGSYTLNVADGRSRVVKYVADGHGFRAAIATNEPGTAALPAAATSISSPFLPPIAPVAEPIAAVAAYAPAPLAIAEPAAYGYGYAKAPLAYAEPAALAYGGGCAYGGCGYGKAIVAVAPAVSTYSTSINHAAPVAAKILAPALAYPAAPALYGGLGFGGLKGGYGGYGKW